MICSIRINVQNIRYWLLYVRVVPCMTTPPPPPLSVYVDNFPWRNRKPMDLTQRLGSQDAARTSGWSRQNGGISLCVQLLARLMIEGGLVSYGRGFQRMYEEFRAFDDFYTHSTQLSLEYVLFKSSWSYTCTDSVILG